MKSYNSQTTPSRVINVIPNMNEIEWSKLITEYSKNCRYKDCIFPNCSKKGIKAHSIQKSKILKAISKNGMVISFDPRKSYYTLNFEELGISRASTFYGFCNTHDTKIFSKIENRDYQETNEQNFLFSYRACAKQYVDEKFRECVLQKMLESANSNHKRIINLEIRHNVNLLAFLSNLLKQFHKELQKNSSNRKYNIITTRIFKLSYSALIAVNSIICLRVNNFANPSVSELNNLENESFLFFNVFPQKSKTFILLSWFSKDISKFTRLFSEIDSYNKKQLENFFSDVIFSQCLNFFISPQKWRNISLITQRRIFRILNRNMIDSVYHDNLPLRSTVNVFQVSKK